MYIMYICIFVYIHIYIYIYYKKYYIIKIYVYKEIFLENSRWKPQLIIVEKTS